MNIDDRFEALIHKIPHMYTGKDYSKVDATSTKNKINLAEIDILASKHFSGNPMCGFPMLVPALPIQARFN